MAKEVFSTSRAPRPNELVIFDFDGTLCLGDDPVLTYAQLVDDAIAARGLPDAAVRDAVQRGLDAGNLNIPEIKLDDNDYPADIAGKTDMVLWPLQDGYQLVQLLGLQAGLDSTETHAAFRASRDQLLTGGLGSSDVHAPDGAVEVLQQLRDRAVLVLITNSPAENFDAWLTQLGLQEQFDLIINSAKKPAGMPAAVQQARMHVETQDER